jgi:hypothetical protein
MVNKELLLQRLNELEIKADHYSRTDWVAYDKVLNELRKLDVILLDIYNSENDTFLQSHDKGIA